MAEAYDLSEDMRWDNLLRDGSTSYILPKDSPSMLKISVNSVLKMLPEKMKQRLNRKIQVEFGNSKDFKWAVTSFQSCDSPAMQMDNLAVLENKRNSRSKIPWTFKTKIILNPSLKTMLKDPRFPLAKSCRFNNSFVFLQSILVHFTARAFDKIRFYPAEQDYYNYCRKNYSFSERNRDPNCRALGKIRGLVSERESYMALTSFFRGFLKYKNKQVLTIGENEEARSFKYWDPRELKDPFTSFAVNFEYFLLDSEYASRRPAVDHLIRRVLDMPERPEGDIKIVFNRFLEDQSWLEVEPKRVSGIYLMQVSKGKDFESKWGHLGVLIAQCAPGKPVTDACLFEDKEYHVVIDFHANKYGWDESKMGKMEGLIKGMSGAYISQLHPFSFADRINYYVVDQQRHLKFYKIQSGVRSQNYFIKDFIYTAFEFFTGFRGSWKHLTNNCVTHLNQIFKVSLPEIRNYKFFAITTPAQYVDIFLDKGLIKEVPGPTLLRTAM